MAFFKCKMCGGTIEFEQGASVGICDSCGTKQTLPRLDDEKRANLYDRANHFRRNNDFDKAMGIYEQILLDDRTDSEAYWSLVLCRYGIEYVKDPATHKRVPTVNRAQFTSIFADEDYKSALKYADGYQKEIYEQEAKAIDEIQKGILAISEQEEPFDIFICYKETDKDGRRTQDSVLANDLYHQLSQEGFKVFFSRITLEDKLGTAYEPYIFAALNSAKVMVCLGTKPEYFNAVWVKNEWSRYLSLVKQSDGKKMLIPAYRDMDPYELPEEFSHLQAQDMGKLGFMQDLIRGIKKIISSNAPNPAVIKETVISDLNTDTSPLLKRAFMFLEDMNWQEADEYCEKVLDRNPECAEAYLGKLMAEMHVQKQESLADCEESFEDNGNYLKALRFGSKELQTALKGYIEHIKERNENARMDEIYNNAVNAMKEADCKEDFEIVVLKLESIIGWKDAVEQIEICKQKIEEIKAKEEADRLEAQRKEEEKRIVREKAIKTRIKIIAITTPIVCVCIAFIIILNTVIIPNKRYKREIPMLKNANVGDTINFGVYKQSNAITAGKEEIKWLVLAKENNKLFIISKKALDCQPFNTTYDSVNWRTSSLRSWLNGTFLNAAFSKKEQSLIHNTTVSTDYITQYDLNSETATKDKVFLLSSAESEKYFTTDESRQCKPTSYAFYNGAFKDSDGYCGWWLRSGGYDGSYTAAYVSSAGAIVNVGNVVDYSKCCVRPVMWINIENNGTTKESKENTVKIEEVNNSSEIFNKNTETKEEKVENTQKNATDIGDIITFGNYEQDNNTSNGKEPIEWQVLAKENNKLFLISKEALDCQEYYYSSYTDITWETCSLRFWLNDTFLNTAFSEKERSLIQTTTVSADKNPEYETNPGNETTDKVFLLSITEVEKYDIGKCIPTDYAVGNGAYGSSYRYCWWWLRSPGDNQDRAALINHDGEVCFYGFAVDYNHACVRPAMWINLDS